MENTILLNLFEIACRHLLSEQDRNPYSPTYGCFDRRYWGWKLVDYAEATYQRCIYPLVWWLEHGNHAPQMAAVLGKAVEAGIAYAAHIQHADGSFDQAFPNEHSFGATAFLLHPMLKAYTSLRRLRECEPSFEIESNLQRAADFLCRRGEAHGLISNHLAGAVLSLLLSADYFQEMRYEQRADELLSQILSNQSSEGWFVEYDGADPGYQTLCLYYLAQVYRLRPDSTLREALARAIDFLAWFIHPDGTFGGEYGSRRTAVYYPGGLAYLASEFPLAASVSRFMLRSIAEGHTTTVADVDMGNLAPLLSNYSLALETGGGKKKGLPPLPCEQTVSSRDFTQAGLFIRGSKRYYAVVGASNGGVLKVYDRQKKVILWDDGGYAGQTARGVWLTTQVTDLARSVTVKSSEICIVAPFYVMRHASQTPFQFIVLRLLNLSVMRNLWLGNIVKRMLVNLLMRGRKTAPLQLTRILHFTDNAINIRDQLRGNIKVKGLAFGRPFVAIHMASANYFENAESAFYALQSHALPVDNLSDRGLIEHQVTI